METREEKSSARAEYRKCRIAIAHRCGDMILPTTPSAKPFEHGRAALRGDYPLPEALLHGHGHEEARLQRRCTDPRRRGSDICCAASGSALHPEPGSLPHVDWGDFTSEIKGCHRARLSYAAQPLSAARQACAIMGAGRHLPPH